MLCVAAEKTEHGVTTIGAVREQMWEIAVRPKRFFCPFIIQRKKVDASILIERPTLYRRTIAPLIDRSFRHSNICVRVPVGMAAKSVIRTR